MNPIAVHSPQERLLRGGALASMLALAALLVGLGLLFYRPLEASASAASFSTVQPEGDTP